MASAPSLLAAKLGYCFWSASPSMKTYWYYSKYLLLSPSLLIDVLSAASVVVAFCMPVVAFFYPIVMEANKTNANVIPPFIMTTV